MSAGGGPCGLTVLHCTGAGRATKQWAWNHHLAQWRKVSYQAGAWFTPAEHQVENLGQLVTVLDQVRRDPRAFVVRGALTPTAAEAVAANPGHLVRRRKHLKNGVAPTLQEVPRRWLLADIDGWPLRASDDLAVDPEAAIDHAVHELLPEAFHDAECWWQLSSSAGFVPGILKAHLWFWLAEPATNPHIKAVLEQHAPGIDRAPFSAAQPHYIADPIIEGGFDPLPRRAGWRKGLDKAVTLPAPAPCPAAGGTGTPAARSAGGGNPLALLGDGDGRQGFHVPLRAATLRYAREVARCGDRDDAMQKAMLLRAMHSVPRKPERGDLADYGDDYLQRLIDGAFGLLAGDAEIRSMQPHHARATSTVEEARDSIKHHVAGFFDRALRWHCLDEAGQAAYPAEHAALADGVGTGKTKVGADELQGFIAAARGAGRPHRILWLVETHKLGSEALARMQALGINVAVLRGRAAEVPGTGDPENYVKPQRMCLNTDAVQDAVAILAPVEQAVCGSGRDGQPSCPWRNGPDQCAYQRQKAEVAQADVVIAAHEALFHAQGEGSGFGAVVVDEAWWQTGLLTRTANLDGFAREVLDHPVLEKGQEVPADTAELHRIESKHQAALAATLVGGFPSKAAYQEAGLTAEELRKAAALHWQRKREGLIQPGQTARVRRERAAMGAGNAAIPRRAAICLAAAALLDGDEADAGRLMIGEETTKGGTIRTVILRTRMEVRDSIARLPMLIVDATLPPAVRHYLPRLQVLSAVQPAAPHVEVIQVVGAWGKRSLVPDGTATPQENRRRAALVQEIADFIALHSEGNGAAITYQAIEDGFQRPGIRTGHFNAVSGLDEFKGVRCLAKVGRVLPKPRDVRDLAIALTGRAIPEEAGHVETRGALMANGEGAALQVRAYADPDLEAVRAAITDAGTIQDLGRGRGVNRTADTPLTLLLFADVVVPLPVSRIVQWGDVRPNVLERMAARGLVLDSPADAATVYPDLFTFRDGRGGSEAAASVALRRLRGSHGDSPLTEVLLKASRRVNLVPVAYQHAGEAQKKRRGLVAPARVPGLAAELTERLGVPVSVKAVGDRAVAPAPRVRPETRPEPPVHSETAEPAPAAATAAAGPEGAGRVLDPPEWGGGAVAPPAQPLAGPLPHSGAAWGAAP